MADHIHAWRVSPSGGAECGTCQMQYRTGCRIPRALLLEEINRLIERENELIAAQQQADAGVGKRWANRLKNGVVDD
jgi:hypothetical protein